jgi:hypothetical protein
MVYLGFLSKSSGTSKTARITIFITRSLLWNRLMKGTFCVTR